MASKMFEATAPDGTTVRFLAPANSTPEQLQHYAFIEYQEAVKSRAKAPEAAPAPEAAQPPAPEAPMEPSLPTEAPQESPEQFEQRLKGLQEQQEIRQAQLFGGAGGAGISALRGGADQLQRGIQSMARSAEQGRIAAQQGMPGANQQVARILQGTPGDIAGTTGRARETGFNIETAQRAAGAKESEQLAERLRQQGVLSRGTPQVLAQMPGLTASPSGVIYPRNVTPPEPPKPTGLDRAMARFEALMGPASTAARYGLPPLALAAAAGEGVRAKQMYEGQDKTGAALAGLSALGALGSLSSTLAPVAIPLGTAAGATQYLRSRLAPDAPVTPEEEAVASRAAFGRYPSMGRRRVVQTP